MTAQPRPARPDINADPAATGASHLSAVLGWPDALRVTNVVEGLDAQPLRRLEEALEALLARGHEAFDGVGLAVRLRVDDLTDELGTGQERHVLVSWPPGSPGGVLLRLEELADTGPGLAAERGCVSVDCGDLAAAQLWPAVTAAALGLGIRSVLAVPVLDHTVALGCLVLYSSETREHSALVMSAKLGALAAHVAVLLANTSAVSAANRTIAQLRDAMLSRSVIEQAKGVLMAREKIDAETAWHYLVRISQRTHRKLRDISTDIVGKASSGAI